MKRIMFTAVLSMFCMFMVAQSGYWQTNSHDSKSYQSRADYSALRAKSENKDALPSFANTYLGSDFLYNILGDGLENNILFNASILYEIPTTGSLRIPIVGTLGIPVSGESPGSIELGIYPYSVIDAQESLTWVIHGGLEFNLDADNGAALDRSRAFLGTELILLGGSGLPVTIGPAIAYNSMNGGDNYAELVITGILPIGAGVGLLAEYSLALSDAIPGMFRLGALSRTLLR